MVCRGRLEPQHRPRPHLPGLHGTIKTEIGKAYPDPEAAQGDGSTTLISSLRRSVLRGFKHRGQEGVSPFPASQVDRIRMAVSEQQTHRGYPHDLSIREHQPFYLSLLVSIGARAHDSEARFPREIHQKGAVPLGVMEVRPSV